MKMELHYLFMKGKLMETEGEVEVQKDRKNRQKILNNNTYNLQQ